MNMLLPVYKNIDNDILLVLIPPGLGSRMHYDAVFASLSDKYGVISFDLPGESPYWIDSDIHEIALDISNEIRKFKNKKTILVGESYGGALLIEMQKYCDFIDMNVIVGSGEFFTNFQKKVLRSMFWLPNRSVAVRRLFAKMLDMVGSFNIGDYSDKQLEVIIQRWFGILDYELPRNQKYVTKTYVVRGRRDNIVNPNSLEKVLDIFPNNVVINTNTDHFSYIEWLDEQFVK